MPAWQTPQAVQGRPPRQPQSPRRGQFAWGPCAVDVDGQPAYIGARFAVSDRHGDGPVLHFDTEDRLREFQLEVEEPQVGRDRLTFTVRTGLGTQQVTIRPFRPSDRDAFRAVSDDLEGLARHVLHMD